MNVGTQWWLHNTAAGRRTLERVLPSSAIPMQTRRQMCVERGHDPLGDGTCRRCNEWPVCRCGRQMFEVRREGRTRVFECPLRPRSQQAHDIRTKEGR